MPVLGCISGSRVHNAKVRMCAVSGSTVAITLYAECMARIHKTPVTVFLVSATIPLIRSSTLPDHELDVDEGLGEIPERTESI